jgi:hypothetical protein
MNNDYKELLNSAKMVYEQVKNYDLHYSNIRTTVSTFLLTTALGLGSYLIGKGSEYYLLGLFMPIAFLSISILNNLFFVYVMGKCAKKAGQLEILISALSLNKEEIKVKKKPELKTEIETTTILDKIINLVTQIFDYIKREFFQKKKLEAKDTNEGEDLKKEKEKEKDKYDTYSISDYLDKFEPLLFRNNFEQTIREFKAFQNAPKSFFGEIGVKSTTYLTIFYFIFISMMMIFQST